MADLTPAERENASTSWAEAMGTLMDFLYHQRSKDANLAATLSLLELPDLLAALESHRKTATPERTVDLATGLEALIAPMQRSRTLAQIVEIRKDAELKLGAWSHAQFEAERAADVERLIDQGRYGEAAELAKSLFAKTKIAGDALYNEAPYDIAIANVALARALGNSGAAQEALKYLDEAHERFQKLGSSGMIRVTSMEKADCLRDLGRYDEAATLYEESIHSAEKDGDSRKRRGVSKGQLATVRSLQRRHREAPRTFRRSSRHLSATR